MRNFFAVSLLTVGIGVWTLTGCAPPAPAGLSEADRASNQELADAFVEKVLAKDWEGVANLYTEDAVLMPPNAPLVTGRAAIQAFFENFPNLTALRANVEWMDGVGDLSYAGGRYEMTISVEGLPEPIQDTGKFLDVRRRQPDGRWLFALDMFNSDLPPAPPPMEEPQQ